MSYLSLLLFQLYGMGLRLAHVKRERRQKAGEEA